MGLVHHVDTELDGGTKRRESDGILEQVHVDHLDTLVLKFVLLFRLATQMHLHGLPVFFEHRVKHEIDFKEG